jgi:cell division transport system ATP-binding protein
MFSGEPIVTIQAATIYQDEVPVLQNVTFSIEKSEFVYLIGRTGSGKSSLLKTLYGDLPLREGTGKVAGYDLHQLKRSDIPYLRRKVGIIFQAFELLTDRTVAENLFFVLRATGWKDRSKMKKRVNEVLMRVGLPNSDNKMPFQLSGGEQQRVAIARALLNEPQILFADEPTGNLDPEVAEGIMKIFHEINKSGTAVLMATHNHQFIDKYQAKVLKCQDGKLIEQSI